MITVERQKEVLAKAFRGNKENIQLVQALMLGIELTKEEKETIKTLFASPELKEVFNQRFLPTLGKDTPVGQQSDEWAGVEEMIYGAQRDTIFQAVHYKKGAIEMTRKALALLDNPEGERPDLSYDPTLAIDDPLAIKLLIRNQFIKHVQSTLSILWVMAEMKDKETLQQVASRLQQDSTQ